jgi:HlyD family secretion protein
MKTCLLSSAFAASLLLTGCEKSDPQFVQGYVEGEFVHVAAPSGGQLNKLAVERGAQVEAGAPLFSLDDAPEKAARDEAASRVAQAKATLEDARLGQRPSEIAAVQAQLEDAKAALALSEKEVVRETELQQVKGNSKRDLDTARTRRERDQAKVAQLSATLETAKLGARDAQVSAAEHALRVQEAALAGAEWSLAQKRQAAPLAAQVTDVVYRQGDWVTAGSPVVVLLPPANVKVRAFVSQAIVGKIHAGDKATVSVDGVSEPYEGRVSYIAPRAEYTPPVIYSQKMREKFVFLVELKFSPDVAVKLHPGQPVDVRFSTP